MSVTLARLQEVLDTRFGGVLKVGSHEENGECCALELVCVAKGLPWSDSPLNARSFDLRPLNDTEYVSDAVRAKYLLPVLAIYSDSSDWSVDRQQKVAERLAILTVNRLTSKLPFIDEQSKKQCENAKTIAETRSAA